MTARFAGAPVLLLSVCLGCGFAPLPTVPVSVGFANLGWLAHGGSLPLEGPGFRQVRLGEAMHFGTPLLLGLLSRAAAAVERGSPGGAPLAVGDLSALRGGRHERHGSHRTGRDADVLFYLVDAQGMSSRASGFYAFDARGVSQLAASERSPRGLTELAYFDTARNWAFVRALLQDHEAPVQWIFCAAGIKARLLLYAAEHEHDRETLLRAAYVLHQPSTGNPHADHFHIRLACTAQERALGCLDAGPTWPWQRNEHEKPTWDGGRLDDPVLLHALLDEDTAAGSPTP